MRQGQHQRPGGQRQQDRIQFASLLGQRIAHDAFVAAIGQARDQRQGLGKEGLELILGRKSVLELCPLDRRTLVLLAGDAGDAGGAEGEGCGKGLLHVKFRRPLPRSACATVVFRGVAYSGVR